MKIILQVSLAVLLCSFLSSAAFSASPKKEEQKAKGKQTKKPEKKNLSPAEQARLIPKLIAQLGNDEFEKREEAEKQLREIGYPAYFALNKASSGRDAEIAARAKKIIGSYKQIMDLLENLPNDWHDTLYYQSLTTTQKKLVRQGPKVIPYLKYRAQTAKEPLYRFNCVSILNKFNTPEAHEVLRSFLTDKHPWCRVESVWALGNAKDKKSLPMMLKLMQDRDATVRKEATMAIGKIANIKIKGLVGGKLYELASDKAMSPAARKELNRLVKHYVEKGTVPELPKLTDDVYKAAKVNKGKGPQIFIVVFEGEVNPNHKMLKGPWQAKSFQAPNSSETWLFFKMDARATKIRM